MARAKTAWGIEVGAYALKAVRLERSGGGVKLADFAVIPHKKVLTTPDVDQDEVIRISLGQFISQKAVEGQRVAVSVPGNEAFSAFTKLPPTEPKQVPNLVRFEAEQQIPFPIAEVEWDYKTFAADDSPDVEVGIFAIHRSKLSERLSLYEELGIAPDVVTLGPLAVYNAVVYDLGIAEAGKPLVILDIATRHSDLVVVDEGRCWFRRLPVGGHNFTTAIAETFNVTYAQAEKLKHEGATGKYAKQVMQSMRPVFTELLESVQRSLEYYRTGASLDTVVGVGSTFRIPGLRKFLGSQLQKEVIRLDEFRRISVEGREGADFASKAVNLWTAYGLALQEVGEAAIDVNLAPIEVLKQQLWAGKTKWFAGAAAIAVAAAGMMFAQPLMIDAGLRSGREDADRQVREAEQQNSRLNSEFEQVVADAKVGYTGVNLANLRDWREIWPRLLVDSAAAIRAGSADRLVSADADTVRASAPGDRRLVLFKDLTGEYQGGASRTIEMRLDLEWTNDDPAFINDTVCAWLRENAERPGVPYRIIATSVDPNTGAVEVFTTDESGVLAGAGSGSRDAAGGSRSGSGARGGDRGASRGGSRGGITGPGGGATLGGGGAGGAVITDDGTKYDAPDRGTLGGGGAGGGTITTGDGDEGSGWESETTGTRGGAGGGAELTTTALDELAPLPTKPTVYPPNTDVRRGFVTFTVEIIDPTAAPAATSE